MKMSVNILLAMVLGYFVTGTAIAQEFFIYPGQGQSNEQLEQDKFQCYDWAKKQTGFDPMEQPTATTPPPQAGAPQGGVVQGAARGALVGVTVGAIAGNKSKGAAIGAASGGLLGGMKRSDQKAQQQQAEQQWAMEQSQKYQQRREEYNRAYKTCLVGRGYTVN